MRGRSLPTLLGSFHRASRLLPVGFPFSFGSGTLREKRPGEDVERLTVERSETGDHDTADQGKELMNGGFYYGFYGSLFTS